MTFVIPDSELLPMKREWTVLEAELAFVIGAGGRHIRPEDAMNHIAGFMVAQDITERMHEFGPSKSPRTAEYMPLKELGKSLDTFCPLGPAIVTADELPDPNNVTIECRLNGVLVQQANTGQMRTDVGHLVSFLSAFVTLRPGDICLTGTPTAIDGQLPRLRPGDLIETHIHGIGTLRNQCVAEQGPDS